MSRGTLLAVLGLLTLPPGSVLGAPERPVNYSRDIKPILAGHCYACHGPDEKKRKAHLRLDVRVEAVKKVIRPGDAAGSRLVRRVSSHDEDEVMPPPASRKEPLTAHEIDLLRRWINRGAKFDQHWAYVRPVRPTLPAVRNTAWVGNPIDRFVAAAHERRGYRPSPQADRVTLLRRLSFDLTGLPPTPEEADRFLADVTPEAYERLVDRLLASPQYGERMALYWLDLVRYADTGGYHSDNHRDVALYRDWVIAAFNQNKSFDRFTIEQLAGDLLPAPTTEQRVASGYNRMLMTTEEGGAQAKEYMAKYSADRVRNCSVVWLASTMGCCECHNHKFDPFLSRDFYQLAAFFADVKEIPVGRQEETPIPTPQQAETLRRLEREMARLQAPLDRAVPGRHCTGRPAPSGEQTRDVLRRLAEHRKRLQESIQQTLVTKSVPPRPIRVLPRGNWLDDSGEVVQPGTPAFLPPLGVAGRRANRLDLARWLVSRDNPLTARVFVNRLWKLTFGQGIVKSVEDFGTQGALPTHSELLDWLAVEFMDSGWDVKHLVRLIVCSNTYRQSSAASRELRERDPSNAWLVRQGRFRLDAELVRDNALAVSGLLVRKVGGPSVKPYQPAGYWSYLNFPKREWAHDQGEDLYRRGLYTYWCRTFPHPALVAFDASTREECVAARARSSTPLQALVLLNDPTYVEAARVLAARAVREGGPDFFARLRWACRQVLTREPRPEEQHLLAELYERHLAQYRSDPAAAHALLHTGDAPMPADHDAAELAAWTSVARVLLNLHEAVTRY
jgi:hypothetical protein